MSTLRTGALGAQHTPHLAVEPVQIRGKVYDPRHCPASQRRNPTKPEGR
jgi:hypothetical protein